MKTQTRKLNMIKMTAMVFTIAMILCGIIMGSGLYSAHAVYFPIEEGATYTITYVRNSLPTTGGVDLKEKLNSITVKLYSKDERELASFTKVRKDNDNWVFSGNDTYTDVNGEIYTYTITYALLEGTYEGVYWKVTRGIEYYDVRDGSGVLTTKPIKITSLVIDTCKDVMRLEKYKQLDISIISRSGFLIYDYYVNFTNPNDFAVEGTYLRKLCFEADAKICGGWTADHRNLNLSPKGSKDADIDDNGTAGSITCCYIVPCIVAGNIQKKNSKIITYATNLKANTCDQYTNIVTYDV